MLSESSTKMPSSRTHLFVPNRKLARRHLVVLRKRLQTPDGLRLGHGNGEAHVGLCVFVSGLQAVSPALHHIGVNGQPNLART